VSYLKERVVRYVSYFILLVMGPYSWFLDKGITLFYWFYNFSNNVGNPLTIYAQVKVIRYVSY